MTYSHSFSLINSIFNLQSNVQFETCAKRMEKNVRIMTTQLNHIDNAIELIID